MKKLHWQIISFVALNATSALMSSGTVRADVRQTNAGEVGGTTELVSYQDYGWQYLVLPVDAAPPAGFESDAFTDDRLLAGRGAFGSRDTARCPLSETITSNWPVSTQIIARRTFVVAPNTRNVRILLSVDNDLIEVFVNGTRVLGATRHDECPIRDEFRVDVPNGVWREGVNTLVIRALDRGLESFLDARVLGDTTLFDARTRLLTSPKKTIPVPEVLDLSTRCRSNGFEFSFRGAETGNFVESVAIQGRQATLTALFMNGRLLSVASQSGQTTVAQRTRFAALLPQQALEKDVLAATVEMIRQSSNNDCVVNAPTCRSLRTVEKIACISGGLLIAVSSAGLGAGLGAACYEYVDQVFTDCDDFCNCRCECADCTRCKMAGGDCSKVCPVER